MVSTIFLKIGLGHFFRERLQLVDDLTSTTSLAPSDHRAITFYLKSTPPIYRADNVALDFTKMNQEAIASHLDIVTWRSLLAQCENVDEMYAQFVACCSFLIGTFVPRRSKKQSLTDIDQSIARLESLLSQGSSDPATVTKRLKKAVLRKRTLTDQERSLPDTNGF